EWSVTGVQTCALPISIRMPNGNTMIAGGNNNRVLEVTPAGKIVWSIDHKELPGITLAWVTTLELLPNGNLIIGNTHAGPDNPQQIGRASCREREATAG